MADTVEMQDIRGLKVDKVAKGFANREYVFKSYVNVMNIKADHVRWFKKTAGTLSAVAPSATSNVSPLSNPTNIEVSWTQVTSYTQKFFVSGIISREDARTAEVGVLTTTVEDLTRVIVRDVDAHIWDVISESQSPSNLQTFATTAVGGDQWDAASYAGNPIKDFMRAKKLIKDQNYSTKGLVAFMNTTDYESVLDWIYAKGAQAPSVGEKIVQGGEISMIDGIKLEVSSNVTDDYCWIGHPKVACTYAQNEDTTAEVVEHKGKAYEVLVWANGIAYLTDPKAGVLITDTQT